MNGFEFLNNMTALLKTEKYFPDALLYNEPDWLAQERIKLSLDAMSKFILDDSIKTRWLEGNEINSPLFLQINPAPGKSYNPTWGRGTWIQDLGTLKYKPAYDSLREVWLHDINQTISFVALEALAKLEDERTIDDIALKLKEIGTLEEYERADNYLFALSNFKTDTSVDVVMDFADILRSLYNGKNLKGESDFEKMYHISPMSDKLRNVMLTLNTIGTDKAIRTITNIFRWFPEDAILYDAYKNIKYESYCNKSKPKLILPKKYNEEMVGIDQGRMVPF